MTKGRDYKKEYEDYQGTPEQIKRRAMRNAARREMVEAGKAHKGDGKDVGHIHGIGKGNVRSNLEMQSEKLNRGWRRGKSGYGNVK